MLSRLHRLRKDRDGQAMVLAAVGMLVLAVGVLATVNLSHAIYERMRLQNNADATAYSLAALEARSFNFFAFVNRAQVSQYVTAMSLQSYLAVMWFVDIMLAVLTMVASIVNWIVCTCAETVIGCVVCCEILGITAAIYQGLKYAHKVFHELAENVLDPALGKMVWAMGKINWVYGQVEKAMKYMVITNLTVSGITPPTITLQNDPEVNWFIPTGLAGAALNLGACLGGGVKVPGFTGYCDAFDTHAESLGGGDPNSVSEEEKMAQRVMTEVSNATRFPIFITNRSLHDFLERIPVIGKLISILDKIGLSPPIDITGQTKLMSYTKESTRCDKRFGAKCDHSRLARGTVIGADQVLEFKFKCGWVCKIPVIGKAIKKAINKLNEWLNLGDKYASVWAAYNDGEHCTHRDFMQIPNNCGTWDIVPGGECKGDNENHKWDGIAPYVKFQPNSNGRDDFNQPSVYVFLNKTPEALGGQAYVQDFNLIIGDHQESLDSTVGNRPIVNISGFTGLNAWSRAMAYYHRPSFKPPYGSGDNRAWAEGNSNWREYPNFFNPFWRAKLAPLGQQITRIVESIGIPGNFADVFARELLTH